MASGITERDTMAYAAAGGAPWHGKGVALAEPLTSAPMARAAGLDWRTELVGLVDARGRAVESHRVVTRTDTGDHLGVVGLDYETMDNADAFAFLDSLVQDAAMVYETAGSLWGGRVVWALGRLGDDWRIADDVHRPYIVVSTSHDGSAAISVQPTTVRVVCANTLRMSLASRKGGGIRYKHTRGYRARLAQAAQTLAITTAQSRAMAAWLEKLAAERAESALTARIIAELFPEPGEDATERVHRAHGERVDLFRARFLTPEVMRSGPTAYALLNAATGYADHGLTYKAPADSAQGVYRSDARFASTLLGGRADTIKATAVAVLRDAVPA